MLLIFVIILGFTLFNNQNLIFSELNKSNSMEINNSNINQNVNEVNNSNLNITFQISLNQTIFVGDDLKLKFLNVSQDSRCPSGAGVMCAWQGQVSIVFDLLEGKRGSLPFELISKAGDYENLSIKELGNYRIKLIKVEPYPNASSKIQDSEYVASVIVSKK